MASTTAFIEKRLKLEVNRSKSAVAWAGRRPFLGFAFYKRKDGWKLGVSREAPKRAKRRLRQLTARTWGVPMERRIIATNRFTRARTAYFALAEGEKPFAELDEWLRRRMYKRRLLGHAVPLLQCGRETPFAWIDRSAISSAVRNGVAIGSGATTRLGFALSYVVPAGALLSGSWLVGAGLYGLCGLTRATGALALHPCHTARQRLWNRLRLGVAVPSFGRSRSRGGARWRMPRSDHRSPSGIVAKPVREWQSPRSGA